MQLTQDKFDQIVHALVDKLDSMHAHVQTVTSAGPAVQFHLGYSVAADALQVALEANGINVIAADADAPLVQAAEIPAVWDATARQDIANCKFRCTPKIGGKSFIIDRAPDSWELRECVIEAIDLSTASVD